MLISFTVYLCNLYSAGLDYKYTELLAKEFRKKRPYLKSRLHFCWYSIDFKLVAYDFLSMYIYIKIYISNNEPPSFFLKFYVKFILFLLNELKTFLDSFLDLCVQSCYAMYVINEMFIFVLNEIPCLSLSLFRIKVLFLKLKQSCFLYYVS